METPKKKKIMNTINVKDLKVGQKVKIRKGDLFYINECESNMFYINKCDIIRDFMNCDWEIRSILNITPEHSILTLKNAGYKIEVSSASVTEIITPPQRIVTIDDKTIELSEESFQSLKQQLTN
jgi:predicted phosphatase